MSDQADVRRIALSLPGAVAEGLGYRVNGKQFVWTYPEKVHPKKPRVPNPEVLCVRVADYSGERRARAAKWGWVSRRWVPGPPDPETVNACTGAAMHVCPARQTRHWICTALLPGIDTSYRRGDDAAPCGGDGVPHCPT
jgi:hypothetical protein